MKGYTNGMGVLSQSSTGSGETNITVPEVKAFSYYGSHLSELSAVLEAHYKGLLDVSNTWSVGDTISVSLSASSTGDWSAQTIQLVILDFKHDYIEHINKYAAVSLGQKTGLMSRSMWDGSSSYNSTPFTNNKVAFYRFSNIRPILNSYYYHALPANLQKLVKPVRKFCIQQSSSISPSTRQTTELCWIPSLYEVFNESAQRYVMNQGSNSYGSTPYDGQQYTYYKTTDNRIKTFNSSNMPWWTRTGYTYSTEGYDYIQYGTVNTDGTKRQCKCNCNQYNNKNVYVVPHFCI